MAWVTLLQFILVAAVVVYLAFNQLHLIRVAPVEGPLAEYPPVTVCVPARNEERDIGACLDSLLQQDYPDYEVIAVDDNSTDGTAKVIHSRAVGEPRLIPLQGQTLPEGWVGKSFALHQASQQAKGDYILFTDADIFFSPSALRTAVFHMTTQNLDMMTWLPATTFGTFWERTIQPVMFGFIAALTRFKKINSADSSSAMGFGAFLFFRKSAYEKIDGHRGVRNEILEDVMLAKRAKSFGLKLCVAQARPLLSLRMYHGFQEIWTGWRKNVFFAMKKSIFRTLRHILVLLAFAVTPFLVAGANLWHGSGALWTGISILSMIMVCAAGWMLSRELGLGPSTVFFYPLGAVMVAAILFNAMMRQLIAGQVQWRGRSYAG
jgi:chlorobactene glucosyltransferase